MRNKPTYMDKELADEINDIMYDLSEWVAQKFLAMGMKPGVSSDIEGYTTYGYGRLDYYGYWEFPLPTSMHHGRLTHFI